MRRPLVFAAVLAAVIGCSQGQGCTGCASLQPLPGGGRYEGVKIDHALDFRLSPDGYQVLNANWTTILGNFLPGQQLQVPLPCGVQNVTLIGDVAIADQGSAGCNAESCGRMDGKCDAKDVPVTLPITINNVTLAPGAPDKVVATLDVSLSTGLLYVDTVSRSPAVCFLLGGGPMKCSVDYNTGRAAPSNTKLTAAIQLLIDTRWDKLLAFTVDDKNVSGATSCGSGQSPPDCIDNNDLVIQTAGSCSICGAASFGPVKTMLVNQIAGSLVQQIQDLVSAQSCQTCSAGEPCPQLQTATSVCDFSQGPDLGFCQDAVTHTCVPRILGVEGRLPVDALLGTFGAPEGAALDLSIAAGGSASSDTGTNIAMRAGGGAVTVADCVKPMPAPAADPITAPDFDQLASGPYDLALSASSQFMNRALYDAQQAGALCIQVTTRNAAQLSTALLATLLPSLGTLTHGEDAPAMVVLRPQNPPAVAVGDGTVAPLLTLTMKDLGIDVYAELDERQVRLFTLTVDLALPMNLAVEQCTSIRPVIQSLSGAVTNVRASNSEILAEDVSTLTDLVPTVIALAEPQLANMLTSFALPPVAGFQVELSEVKGGGALTATGFEHLAVFTKLLPEGTPCAALAPTTQASPLFAVMPATSRAAAAQVTALGAKGQAQFAYRVDRGLWFDFQPAPSDGVLTIDHPAFLLPGRHVVEVRARGDGAPYAVSAPVAFEIIRDLKAPVVAFSEQGDELRVSARDDVTAEAALAWSYRFGAGDWSSFGAAQAVSLAQVEATGSVTVRVRDEAGNVGEAVWRTARTQLRPDADDMPAASGCASVPGDAAGALLLALGALLSRRGRRA